MLSSREYEQILESMAGGEKEFLLRDGKIYLFLPACNLARILLTHVDDDSRWQADQLTAHYKPIFVKSEPVQETKSLPDPLPVDDIISWGDKGLDMRAGLFKALFIIFVVVVSLLGALKLVSMWGGM